MPNSSIRIERVVDERNTISFLSSSPIVTQVTVGVILRIRISHFIVA